MEENQAQNKPKTNLLANYFRQPKLYLKLPSRGRFYPQAALDKSEIDEYAVYAMTAKDELMLKTPDALMNGSATVEVIKSCVPSIKNPWQMPSIDLDAVLIAIRIATYGEGMDVSSTCPECGHINDYVMNLVNYLDETTRFEYRDTIQVGPLVVHIKPYTYQEVTKTAIKTLEQQKIFNIVNDETMPDEEKIEKFGESFVKLTQLTVDIVVGCINSIETPEGSVDDKEMIQEFISNASSDVFKAISEHVNGMRDQMSLKAQGVKCTECEHEWDVEVAMDQANFFGVGS